MLKDVRWSKNKVIKKRKIRMLNNVKIFGVDTETLFGEPHTLQVYADFRSKCVGKFGVKEGGLFGYVDKENVTDTFLQWLDKIIFEFCDNAILYGYNLRFDLPVIFFQYYRLFQEQEHFSFYYQDFRITILYAQNCFAVLEKNNKRAYIIDIRNFFRSGSLDYLAEFFQLPVRKIEKPIGLGSVPLTEKDIPYAMRDAEIAYLLGQIIRETDVQFELDVSFSCAGLAEQIFRQQFLKNEIRLPHKAVVGAAMLSYHGGRNWYKYNTPCVVENCYEYDIKSAYAWAMTQLPDFAEGEYKWFDTFNQHFKYSICKVKTKSILPYNLCFTDDGSYANGNNSFWITYPELIELFQYGNYIEKIEKQIAYIPKFSSQSSPTRNFVHTFFALREQAKEENDTVKSEMYKLIMNSLYGKFIQTLAKNKVFFLDEKTKEIKCRVDYVAAGLFHPFIATLITGLVRGRLLKAERLSNAFHSSTDSIKTTSKMKVGDGIGDFEKKVFGDCIVLRNRLYLHYDNETGKVSKFALHGFRGRAEDLEQAIFNGNTEITTKRILWPKEAKVRKLKALEMIEYKQKLNVVYTPQFLMEARKIIEKQRKRREKGG